VLLLSCDTVMFVLVDVLAMRMISNTVQCDNQAARTTQAFAALPAVMVHVALFVRQYKWQQALRVLCKTAIQFSMRTFEVPAVLAAVLAN
jgi:hypothetical protein